MAQKSKSARRGIAGGAAALSLGLLGLGAAPAQAEPGPWTVSLNIADHQFTSYDCTELPVSINVSGDIAGSWKIQGVSRLRGLGYGTSWLAETGTNVGSSAATIEVCPEIDKAGLYDLTGTVTVGTGEWAPLSISYNLLAMPSTTELTGVKQTTSKAVITGRVIAQSATLGSISGDPSGKVTIERRKGDTWYPVATKNPDEIGNFTFTIRAISQGGELRAVYQGSGAVAASTSAVLQVGKPQITVNATATKSGGKLHLNVDPGTPGRYYFRVQRNNGTNWVSLKKTYATKGAGEVATLDLPAGVYRVVVLPKKGGLVTNAIGVSAAVTLKK